MEPSDVMDYIEANSFEKYVDIEDPDFCDICPIKCLNSYLGKYVEFYSKSFSEEKCATIK